MDIATLLLPLLAGRMTEDERKREAARQDMEANQADAMERLKAQIDLGKTLIQSLILANGGAIVALFTLIGKQGDQLMIDPTRLWWAFWFFIGGLILALASGLAGFLSQYWFYLASAYQAWQAQSQMLGTEYTKGDPGPPIDRGNLALKVGIICAGMSLACFAFGSFSALSGALRAATMVVAPS